MDKNVRASDLAETNLSPREREVAELVAHGKSNRAIAETLFLSERTVETHVSSILSKLSFHSRVELLAAVLQGDANVDSLAGRHHVPSNNLPIQLTSLLGREHDIDDVKSLLGQHNLVTVSGAGGVGKTRLALRVGADVLDHYSDGVWFVDLAPISDPELVSSVIARVLGMSQQEDRRVDPSIPRWLKNKQLLLILDNCEHLLGAVVSIAENIARSCTKVRMLATSRQALDIGGEVVYRLPSLTTPDKAVIVQAAEAPQYAAIALFVDRAKAADNHFALTDETAPTVADICRRLDGIPLAIELAAARVKVLSIPNIARRLNDRFKVLTGGSRTAVPRQKTLGALIDWSYDLLDADEQALFKRLGIFAGGFSLAAVAAVHAGDDLDETGIVDLLSSLTDKSLVVADTSGEQERYRLLESTRAYALEKLDATGEREQLARRHSDYFRAEAEAADKRFGTGSTGAWLTVVELELDNYRATLEWALTNGHDVALGGELAGALEHLWFDGGLLGEGRYWIGLAQAELDEVEQPRVAARLWRASARLSGGKRRHACAERALTLYQSIGDDDGATWALLDLVHGLLDLGRIEQADEANSRALTAAREQGNKWGLALSLLHQAGIDESRGDFAAARLSYVQALETFEAIGDEAGIAWVLADHSELEFEDGRVEQALRLVREAIDIDARGKNVSHLALDHSEKTVFCIALGDLTAAREAAREALRWALKAHSVLLMLALQHFALLGALGGQISSAARLIGYVNANYEELELQRASIGAAGMWGLEKLMATLREHLSDAEIDELAAEGAAWSEDRTLEAALEM